MTGKTTRRAVLAGAAASVSATTAALALPTPAEPDPIFAAIERHRAAYIRKLRSDRFAFDMVDGPEKDAANVLAEPHNQAWRDAASDLTTIAPTTVAGVVALIDHVAEFNMGGVFLEGDRFDWSSSPEHWPQDLAEDDASMPKGDFGVVDYGWLILRNIANALRAISPNFAPA